MKKNFLYTSILLFSIIVFNSCNQNNLPDDPFPSEEIEGCYVVNFGSFGQGGASISKYDYEIGEMNNFFYQSQNDGHELLSNIQYASSHNDSIFLIGNAVDQIITVNPFIEQSLNGVTEDIENPRFFVADGDYLYISCLGTNPDWDIMPDSYIAKYNIITRSIESKIMVPGGPEGLEIVNGKLYVALNYKNSIVVIDLISEELTEITTPAVSSYFVKDNNGNLYFTLLSTFNNFSEETGIGYINTTNDQMETYYNLENVSTSYGSVLQANPDFSKIYIITSAYDANWNLTGAVAEFDVSTNTFSTENIIDNISGISGLAVNPSDGDIYVFSAQSTTGVGMMQVYSESGEYSKEFEVGAFPVGAFFLD